MIFARRMAIASAAVFATALPALAQQKACPNPNALGVSRVVEIDTAAGPGFGFEHYKAYDFLQPKEVVLTFDDGPQKFHTEAVLAALAHHCTKATFFSIGKMALGYPEIIRKVAAEGHTIGTHTWSHALLRKKATAAEAVDEIERGMSAVKRAVGGPIAPLFRYPALQDTPETLAHLQSRNVGIFSTDIDSFDFKIHSGDHFVKSVIDKLEKKGKGIVLMHDIQPATARNVPALLDALKAHGFRIVQIKAKGELATLPEFDTAIESSVKGLPGAGAERPTSAVVRTIEGGQSKLGGEPAAAATSPTQTTNPGTPVDSRAVAAEPAGGQQNTQQKKWFWQQK